MDRTRRYYEAQGFEQPYRWAHFDETPFTPLEKPLSEARVTVVTTGARYDRRLTDPRFVDSGSTRDLPAFLYATDLAWDKDATHLNDLGTYLPINVLEELVAAGELGALSDRFHCVPTEYSQRRTKEIDAPEILKRCSEDRADLALLIPL